MLSLSQENVRTRFGLFYFALTFNTANSQQLVPVMLSFRQVFQLQKEGHYYRPITYYLSLLVVNIPIAAVESFIFLVIVYPLSGLHGGIGSTQFGYCYLMMLLVNLVSRSWVILLASVTSTEALMNILNGISLVIFSIFSGYLNPRDSIPAGWIWAYYISSVFKPTSIHTVNVRLMILELTQRPRCALALPLCSYYTWAMRGLMINEQKGLVYECGAVDPAFCQYKTGDDALALYGMDDSEEEKWYCILYMALFLVGFNVLAAISMKYVTTTGVDHEEEPNFQPVQTIAQDANGTNHALKTAGSNGAPAEHGSAPAKSKSAGPVPDASPVHAAAAAPVAGAGDLGDVPAHTHAVGPHDTADTEELIASAAAKGGKAGAVAAVAAAAQAPSAGGCISWQNLCYTVDTPTGPRKLLDNVLGFAKPGMLVALMVRDNPMRACIIV